MSPRLAPDWDSTVAAFYCNSAKLKSGESKIISPLPGPKFANDPLVLVSVGAGGAISCVPISGKATPIPVGCEACATSVCACPAGDFFHARYAATTTPATKRKLIFMFTLPGHLRPFQFCRV